MSFNDRKGRKWVFSKSFSYNEPNLRNTINKLQKGKYKGFEIIRLPNDLIYSNNKKELQKILPVKIKKTVRGRSSRIFIFRTIKAVRSRNVGVISAEAELLKDESEEREFAMEETELTEFGVFLFESAKLGVDQLISDKVFNKILFGLMADSLNDFNKRLTRLKIKWQNNDQFLLQLKDLEILKSQMEQFLQREKKVAERMVVLNRRSR